MYYVHVQATFEDDLIDDAKAKKHSLTCEAVEVGAKVSQSDGFSVVLCNCSFCYQNARDSNVAIVGHNFHFSFWTPVNCSSY